MEIPVLPGAPYVFFLDDDWYAPQTRLELEALGFAFHAPNAFGQARPRTETVVVPDMLLSELLAWLGVFDLTLSLCYARYWEGDTLPPEACFWYFRIHADA